MKPKQILSFILIAFVIAIPGSREDQIHVNRYIDNYNKESGRKSFLREFKACLKHKNLTTYTIANMFYRSLEVMMIGSIPYFVL